MTTLVHAPRSRSSNFLWLLEEFGEPYRVQYVSIRRGDGSGTIDPSNPHPHGKVPVLIDETAIIFEQSAIALYLADKYPLAGLGPRIEDPARGGFLTLRRCGTGIHVKVHARCSSARHGRLGRLRRGDGFHQYPPGKAGLHSR